MIETYEDEDDFNELYANAEKFFGSILDKLRAVARPDQPSSIWEWADRYRILPATGSVAPGPYESSKTPYIRDVLDCLHPSSPVERVVVMKSVQLGFTEAFHNLLGYLIDSGNGGPIMLVMPTVDVVSRNIIQKIQPMIDSTPSLREKFSTLSAKDSNSRLFKTFPGGLFVGAGANSSAAFRNLSIKTLCLDEVDGYPLDCGEGPPDTLAMGRTDGYPNRKIFMISTPTFESTSRIKSYYLDTDQRLFLVPAPCCGHYQVLKFTQLRWEEKKAHNGVYYECANCSERFTENHKMTFLQKGRWEAQNPGHRGGKYAGFQINSLYSPYGMLSWESIAEKWEAAKNDQNKLISFKNTVEGECYALESSSLSWEVLMSRREKYTINSLPVDDIAFITAGVDVQGDRLEVGIWGWRAYTKEAYAIDHRIIHGRTTEDSTWDQLEHVIGENWKSGENFLSIDLMCIDSGYNTQKVYQFCRKFPHTKVRPIKGDDKARVTMGTPRQLDQQRTGKSIRTGLRSWPVGVTLIKEEISGWLSLRPDTAGKFPRHYVHFPEFDAEWFRQMCAEALVIRTNPSGERKYVWEMVNHKHCEAWDCFIYARAAAFAVGLDRMMDHHWGPFMETRRAAPQLSENEPQNNSDDNEEAEIERRLRERENAHKRRRMTW